MDGNKMDRKHKSQRSAICLALPTFAIVALLSGSTAAAISSPSSAQSQVGASFSFQLQDTQTIDTWSVSGLPNGLFCSSAGSITGIPTQAGTFSVSIVASYTYECNPYQCYPYSCNP